MPTASKRQSWNFYLEFQASHFLCCIAMLFSTTCKGILLLLFVYFNNEFKHGLLKYAFLLLNRYLGSQISIEMSDHLFSLFQSASNV